MTECVFCSWFLLCLRWDVLLVCGSGYTAIVFHPMLYSTVTEKHLWHEITLQCYLRMIHFWWKDTNVPASAQVVPEQTRLPATLLLFISCILLVSYKRTMIIMMFPSVSTETVISSAGLQQPALVYAVLWTELRSRAILGKRSANWVTCPSFTHDY